MLLLAITAAVIHFVSSRGAPGCLFAVKQCVCLRSVKQKQLVNDIVLACTAAEGRTGEAPVTARPQMEFLRDLLLAQGIQKAPGSDLDDLLARLVHTHSMKLSGPSEQNC